MAGGEVVKGHRDRLTRRVKMKSEILPEPFYFRQGLASNLHFRECEGSLCSSGAAWGSGGCGAAVSVAKGGGGVLGDFRGQVRVDAGSGRRAVAQPLLNQP